MSAALRTIAKKLQGLNYCEIPALGVLGLLEEEEDDI